MMTTCEACTHAYSTEQDMVPDMIRAQRLLLTVLNGDGDAALLVAGELNCFDCRGRILSLFLTMTGGLITVMTGSQDKAIELVQEGLLSDLDVQ
jgi:hypothetical protein